MDDLKQRLRDMGIQCCDLAAAALDAKDAEISRLRTALQFYADGYYIGDGDCNAAVYSQDLKSAGDTGQIARAALTDNSA